MDFVVGTVIYYEEPSISIAQTKKDLIDNIIG